MDILKSKNEGYEFSDCCVSKAIFILCLATLFLVIRHNVEGRNVPFTKKYQNHRRYDKFTDPTGTHPETGVGAGGGKFEKQLKPRPRNYSRTDPTRTFPHTFSFLEDCEYVAYHCLKAHDTGKVCGRTLYYVYFTFKNYCQLNYVNCMERYDLWMIAYMGECYNVTQVQDYMWYPYLDDYFLDQLVTFENTYTFDQSVVSGLAGTYNNQSDLIG